MKILDLNPVTPSVGVIIQKNTLLHITDAYKESFESLGKSMLPVSAYTGKLVVLYGCVITGTNPGARTITAGAVFYNGQVYQVQASTFTTTGSQIGIWTLVDLNAASIESKLTDGTDVHMLVNNAFVFSAGAAASGLFDETSASIERVGTWKIGASSILFSSIVGSGMS